VKERGWREREREREEERKKRYILLRKGVGEEGDMAK